MLKPGTIIGDKYRLERVLGRGGMGTVIEARHVQLGTQFALKFIHRSIAENATVPERFLREARAAAAIGSDHVCRVFDVGTYDGSSYLVMELLEGTDLEQVLRRQRRLAPSLACGYLIQACAGVADAHAAQIVHRDLKPSNLFLATRPGAAPIVKVLDFGIAKAPQETELGLTGTDTILGSPAYMSLEQLRSSRHVDPRSDIWSLGVILYELLAGRRPFEGEGIADLALRIAMEPVPRLPEGPEALDDVIACCLARDPAQRYANVGELALALAPFAEAPERHLARSLSRASRASRPSSPPAVAPSPPPRHASPDGVATVATGPVLPVSVQDTTLQTAGAIERTSAPRRRRARWLAPAVLAASVVGGVSFAIAARGDDTPPATQPTRVGAADAVPAQPPAPPPPPPQTTPAAAPIAPPAAAKPPAPTHAPAPITLRFALDPSNAAVELDGVFVTARQIKVSPDEAAHRLRITAPGFVAQEREVHFDESQQLLIHLARVPARHPATVTPRSENERPARIESQSPYE